MRKTVRADLECPHCGQEIRFNERNPAFLKKQLIEETREKIRKLQKYLGDLEKKTLVRKTTFTCPYKDCGKLVYEKVTPRKIVLSKRVPKALRVTANLMERFM